MKKFPQRTISRALIYIRTLAHLLEAKQEVVSSSQLSLITGLSDVQIRKDISNFGKVGRPRIGYRTAELKQVLENYILQNIVHAVLFGVGNLGSALLKYPGFHQDKVKLVAAFDTDKKKIGTKINDVKIYPLTDAQEVISNLHVEIGIIAVPVEYSQKVADIIIKSGLKGIVNFTPTTVTVPKEIIVKNIDLTIEFLSLFCDIQ
ncbi:MAG: redox-sensing transcriptional repressor Rex [Candidatus Omnitrophica bacterium]|nr:redox-sensing transcriptional repressor Rex [Candidatus Omnitrophota bacterium]MBU1996963.1 redox-sensing transcriptional repressor Rex [Candidatus Omnitrophota bacterium]